MSRLPRSHRLVRLSLLAMGVSLLSLALAACGGFGPAPTVTPTATRAPRPTNTATATETATPAPLPPTPTVTLTATATATPSATHTLLPTVLPTVTATRPPANTATPRPPTATPLPTSTAKPAVDFIVASKRLLARNENGGQCMGNNNFYVTVVDAAGQPLNDIGVQQQWDGMTPNDAKNILTGSTGSAAGQATLAHGAGVYRVLVTRDAAGRTYTSQAADQLITDYPPQDWLRAAGYCNVDPGKCENCYGHYSYQIVFRRTW